ncbi:MAG TPA: 50S ribosomal protein L11 methyltransferase [Candidatus Binatus sp.]|nr:50S ribosomal protein L11 methyltransferase [Candidatus Binatus sp.]
MHLIVHTRPANIDAIADFLIQRGAPGVIVKGRGLEAYFRRSGDDAALKQLVQDFLRGFKNVSGRGAKPRPQWRFIGAENWHESWRRFIKPARIGKSFWVTPPWLTPPKFRGRQVITIEPGLAFGTGTHATTRGCIEFIEDVANRLAGRKFTALDVGTGAGILAIALVKLGAQQVWAIDNDPVALGVARENFRINHVTDHVHLSGVDIEALKKKFPLVAANLTAETILELRQSLESKVAPCGWLILSGVMVQKADAILRRFRGSFRLVRQKRGREWVTLLLRRK